MLGAARTPPQPPCAQVQATHQRIAQVPWVDDVVIDHAVRNLIGATQLLGFNFGPRGFIEL